MLELPRPEMEDPVILEATMRRLSIQSLLSTAQVNHSLRQASIAEFESRIKEAQQRANDPCAALEGVTLRLTVVDHPSFGLAEYVKQDELEADCSKALVAAYQARNQAVADDDEDRFDALNEGLKNFFPALTHYNEMAEQQNRALIRPTIESGEAQQMMEIKGYGDCYDNDYIGFGYCRLNRILFTGINFTSFPDAFQHAMLNACTFDKDSTIYSLNALSYADQRENCVLPIQATSEMGEISDEEYGMIAVDAYAMLGDEKVDLERDNKRLERTVREKDKKLAAKEKELLAAKQKVADLEERFKQLQRGATSSNSICVSEEPMSKKKREENLMPINTAAMAAPSYPMADETQHRFREMLAKVKAFQQEQAAEQRSVAPLPLSVAGGSMASTTTTAILAAYENAKQMATVAFTPEEEREEEREEEKREKKQKLCNG